MAAAITLQKTRHAANGLAQVIFVRQEHQAEMVQVRPVKARALHQQDFSSCNSSLMNS